VNVSSDLPSANICQAQGDGRVVLNGSKKHQGHAGTTHYNSAAKSASSWQVSHNAVM
jgi:hypothetical protein